jgi:hypothetical protein
MRALVLAYHAQNCGGYDYASNDHIAFAQDLDAIRAAGLPLVSLDEIASRLAEGKADQLPDRCVGLSCDDGTSLDWQDYLHPEFGSQKSLANILRDHLKEYGNPGEALLTAFVIASGKARAVIDRECYGGAPLSDDSWWAPAAREGLVSIQNHSWDHLHEVIPASMLECGVAGDFYSIVDYRGADLQIRRARESIDNTLLEAGKQVTLFAYPYGHASSYLRDEYLPQCSHEHGMTGAYTTEQGFIEADTPVFALPRMVCGDAWNSAEQFSGLLQRLVHG